MKKIILLIFILLTAPTAADNHNNEFTMVIMDVFQITGRGLVLNGRIESGVIETGDTVCVPLNSDETAAVSVEGLETFRKVLDRAETGQMVGVLVHGIDKNDVNRNAILHNDCQLETNEEDVNLNEE